MAEWPVGLPCSEQGRSLLSLSYSLLVFVGNWRESYSLTDCFVEISRCERDDRNPSEHIETARFPAKFPDGREIGAGRESGHGRRGQEIDGHSYGRVSPLARRRRLAGRQQVDQAAVIAEVFPATRFGVS